jgi:hypothetical protein
MDQLFEEDDNKITRYSILTILNSNTKDGWIWRRRVFLLKNEKMGKT